MLACFNKHTETAFELLAHNADVNIQSRDKKTALLFACENKMQSTVVELLKRGVQTNVVDENGDSALLIACRLGKIDMAISLIASGADVNIANKQRESALLLALSQNLVDVMVALLQKDVNIHDVYDSDGNTALHYFCSSEFPEDLHRFIPLNKFHTINIVQKNNFGKSPLQMLPQQWALQAHKRELVKSILTPYVGKDITERSFTWYHFTSLSYLEYYERNPQKLIDLAFDTAANPIEIAFLFQAIPLSRTLASCMSQSQYESFTSSMEQKYPLMITAIRDFCLQVEYDIDVWHLQHGVVQIPPKPQGVEVKDLLQLFEEVNFFDPQKTEYYDPIRYELPNDRNALRASLQELISKVENRVEFVGTPKANTPAIEDFYKTIENGITNVLLELRVLGDAKKKAEAMIDILKDCTFCGGKIYTLAVDLFQRVVKKNPVTFEQSIYHSLADRRLIQFHAIVPKHAQNSHAATVLYKAFGKELGIPGGEDMGRFHDTLGMKLSEDSIQAKKREFLELYKNPVTLFSEWFAPLLQTDGALREKYVSFWQESAPAFIQGKRDYMAIREHIKALSEKPNVDPKEITAYLETQELYFPDWKVMLDFATIRDLYVNDFIETEVYKDINTNSFHQKRFIECLSKIRVFVRSVTFNEKLNEIDGLVSGFLAEPSPDIGTLPSFNVNDLDELNVDL